MGNLCCCCPTWTRKESEIVCPQPQPNSDVQQVTSEIRNLSVQDQQIQPTVINQQPAKKLEKSVSDGATVLRNSTVRSNSSVRSKTAVPAAIIVPQQKSVVTKHPNPLTKPKLVCVRASNLEFIANIIEDYAEALNWDDLNYKQSQLHFIKLDHYSCEYEDVESQFNSTNKSTFHKIGPLQLRI
ncbi:hypothetical protein QE152_g1532 [Popillia japonica]|uniref:Uncharacterized protein n=1 Tax=Popillia japonica TaxID=7064 RepID=A0AAW1N6L9_POPJA